MAAQDKNTSRKPSLLGQLKTAVKKVIFLMKLNKKAWRLAAAIFARGRGCVRGRALSSRRWSFNESIGLIAIMSSPSDHDRSMSNSLAAYMTPSPDFSPEVQHYKTFTLQKTNSLLEKDDINKRSELFIARFRRHLMLEREASLRLRYIIEASCRRSKSFP